MGATCCVVRRALDVGREVQRIEHNLAGKPKAQSREWFLRACSALQLIKLPYAAFLDYTFTSSEISTKALESRGSIVKPAMADTNVLQAQC